MMWKAYESHAPEGANAYAESRVSPGYPVKVVQYYQVVGEAK